MSLWYIKIYRQTSHISAPNPRTWMLLVASAESIKARCYVENEDVVGAAPSGDDPTTSEWSTSILPTKVRLILKLWQHRSISAWGELPVIFLRQKQQQNTHWSIESTRFRNFFTQFQLLRNINNMRRNSTSNSNFLLTILAKHSVSNNSLDHHGCRWVDTHKIFMKSMGHHLVHLDNDFAMKIALKRPPTKYIVNLYFNPLIIDKHSRNIYSGCEWYRLIIREYRNYGSSG